MSNELRRPWKLSPDRLTVLSCEGEAIATANCKEVAATIVACVNAMPDGSGVLLQPRCHECGCEQAPLWMPPDPMVMQ